jgi:hypothetical protein
VQSKFYWACFALLSVLIQGCPSSGSSTTPLGGVAAVGAPLAGATVILVDAAGTTKTATADAEGAYTFDDVGAMTAPFLLKASGVVGGEEQTIYSALDEKPTPGETAVLNATPMTNAVVAQLSDGDPAKLFAAPTTMGTFIKPADMGAAKQKIMAVLEDQIKEQGLPFSTFDPFKTPFKADSKGVDKMFDLIKIRPSATGEMVITDKNTGIAKSITKAENLSAVQAKKLPPPDPELKKLDFSKIKVLIDGMNTAIKNKSSMDALFDTGFKSDGKERDAFLLKFSGDKAPEKLSGYQFGGCNIDTKVCDGMVAFISKDGTVVQGNLPVIYTNDTWKWYGNRRDFSFYFGQHILIDNTFNVSNGKLADPVGKVGFILDLMDGNRKFDRVELLAGIEKTVNSSKTIEYETTAIAEWEPSSDLNCPAIVNKKNSSSCSSFADISDLGIDTTKPTQDLRMIAYTEGKLYFKFKFIKSGSTTKEVVIKPTIENIPKSDSNAYKTLITNAFVTEVTQGFFSKTAFVMPKGVSVESMTLFLSDSLGQPTASNVIIDRVGVGFASFGETISIAEICEVHKKNATSSQCSANNIISAIYWTFKTPLSVDTKVTFGFKRAP